MKNKLLKLLTAVSALFVLFASASCASSSKLDESGSLGQNLNHSFKDGIYYFSGSYHLESYDFYAGNTEVRTSIDKNFYGSAVFIKDSAFIEPEFKLSILINEDLSVSSPENPSVSGKAEKDGRLHFSALLEQNGQTFLLTGHSLFLWHGDGNDSIYKKYNGKYDLENSSGEKIELDAADGVYKGDFQGTINPDGTFYNGYVQTTEISMGEYGKSYTSLDFKEEGIFTAGGGLEIKSFLKTNTAYGSGESKNIYSSTNISSSDSETAGSLLNKKGTSFHSPYRAVKNTPVWYEFGVKSDNDYYYACGTAVKEDKEIAAELAKVYALSVIAEFKKTDVSSKTRISSDALMNKDSSSSKTQFAQDSVFSSSISSSYETLESFFDSQHGRAYVKIRVNK